jgi:hypothetical protein
MRRMLIVRAAQNQYGHYTSDCCVNNLKNSNDKSQTILNGSVTKHLPIGSSTVEHCLGFGAWKFEISP